MAISKLTSADFKREVEDRDGRVFVDFYADWCGPCRQVAPTLEELSSKWEGTVRFVKVNIDDNPQLARKYGVLSISTIMLFEEGQAAARTMGARPANAIERMAMPPQQRRDASIAEQRATDIGDRSGHRRGVHGSDKPWILLSMRCSPQHERNRTSRPADRNAALGSSPIVELVG